jgi:hypothetical protein
MKPRHAAALALVGWIWVVKTDFGSAQGGSFPTRGECEKALSEEIQLMKKVNASNEPLKHSLRGECIRSDDDPRLKGK